MLGLAFALAVALLAGSAGLLLALILWATEGSQPVPAVVRRFEGPRESPPGAAPRPRAGGRGRGFSLLSYNIGYASGRANNVRLNTEAEQRENLGALRGLLETRQPELAALQEVDLRARRSFDVDQAARLGEGLYDCAAVSVTWDMRYVPYPFWPPSNHFGRLRSGQVTLSASPIELAFHHVFAKPPSNGWLRNMFYLERLALFTRVEIAGRPILLVNVHLEAFDAGVRAAQAAELRQILSSPSHGLAGFPLIVAGDFNDESKSAAVQALCDGGFLRPAISAGAERPTFPSWGPTQTLDHVLVSPQFEVHDSELCQLPGPPSDHLPVLLELSIK